MAYGLPVRGQNNWDDELNNSMEALHSDVQSAQADATSARNDASYAKTKADEAVATANGVAANTDTQTAYNVQHGPETQAALNDSFAGRTVGIDVRVLGAKADEQSAVCSITSGTNILTRSSGAWTIADVGKVLSVPGAQASADTQGRNNMPAKITGFTNATTVTLDRTAGATVSGATVLYATDNTATLQAALDAARAGFLGDTFVFPDVGKPFYVDMLMPHSYQKILGPGEVKQIPRNWNDAGTSTSNGGTIMPWDAGRGVETPPTYNVLVERLKVNGNKHLHYGPISNRTNGEGINFKYGRNCVAAYCQIWDTNGDGIDFDHSEDCLAVGNIMTDCSGWGIHTSEGNKNNRYIGNTARGCGWDQYVESGVTCGGFDCSQNSYKITYIGNTGDGNRINFSLGSSGLYDPAVYQLISVGNRDLSDYATPAYASTFQAVIPDVPDTITKAITFTQPVTFQAEQVGSGTAATDTLRSAWVAGDVKSRWSVRASGSTEWGDGTNAHDVILFRSNANELQLGTGDSLRLDGTYTAPLRLGNYRIWVEAATALPRIKTSAPTSDSDGVIIGGETNIGASSAFNSATSGLNTVAKYQGKRAYNTTLNRPVWATGSTATSTWVYADGTTAHTPA